MYKVLLVDDESWVVESLKDLVDWNGLGFEVVGQAENGGEALEAMKEHAPDVVFTDIRMPEMNGLELIRRGRSLPGNMRFVVVSGYAEFAYAQKAISYGAAAYCLKPFDDIEITGVLKKLKDSLDGMRPSADDTLQLLLDEAARRDEKQEDELDRRGISEWIRGGVVPVVAVGADELPLPPGRVLRLKTGSFKTAYLMGEAQAADLFGRLGQSMPEHAQGVGFGEAVDDRKRIVSAMESADVAAYQFFVSGRPGAYKLPLEKRGELNERMLEVHSAIADKNAVAAHAALDRIEALFREGSLTIRDAYQVYNMTNSFLFNLGRQENILYGYEQLVRTFSGAAGMMAELGALVDRYVKHSGAFAAESKNQTFNAILHFISENYREDVSLQDLSDQFFMNPSYISQLFKKEVGETFTAYVSRLRIEKACELLVSGRDSIQEIAEKIGYRDYFYFTRLFKKLTGKTPTQFREESH